MARIVSSDEGERRLESELDRAARYRRPVTVALLRIEDPETVARALRPMDLLASYGDDYLAILPELDRREGLAALAKLPGVERRAVAVSPDDGMTVDDVLAPLRARPTTLRNVRDELAKIERAAIVTALQKEQNNQTRAAQRLGLSRRAFIYKLEKYGLKAPPPRGR